MIRPVNTSVPTLPVPQVSAKSCYLLLLRLFISFRIPPVLFIQLTLGPKLPAAPPSANHREQGVCLLVWAGAQIEFCSADIRKRPQRTEFGIIKGVPPSLALITPPLVWMAQPPPPGKEGRGEEGVHVMPSP